MLHKVRGVNLGGWFVLERWMSVDLFDGVEGKDETAFSLQKPSAESFLKHHWSTFITEQDFEWIAKHQLNSVRIPFPWWIFGDVEPYYSCLPWLDKAMDWAKKYRLAVCLDLHTAPGCQNGFDNGGIEGVCTWHHNQQNIEKTIEILERIALRYKDHDALWGIEVLNEPRWDIDMAIIKDFYVQAYTRLRNILKPEHVILFHDAFRHHEWETFFQEHNCDNVALDCHLYQCFDDKFNKAGYLFNVRYPLHEQIETIQRVSKHVRCIVGEWSLGLNPYNVENLDSLNKHLVFKSYASNQLLAFEQGYGWYFWNYKIASGSPQWNFRTLVETGVLPNDYKI